MYYLGNLIRGVLFGAGLSSSDHVGLEQCALKEDMVVVQGLVHEGQNGLGHLLGTVQVVLTIRQHLQEGNNATVTKMWHGGGVAKLVLLQLLRTYPHKVSRTSIKR